MIQLSGNYEKRSNNYEKLYRNNEDPSRIYKELFQLQLQLYFFCQTNKLVHEVHK